MPPTERDEDSGLHDIRSMASSTKMRLSSRRTSTSPPIDEDILASSSAGWKAVALPEPARMVSLPTLDELPSVEDVKKAERKSKKELKAERTSAKEIASAAIAIDTAPISAAVSPAPVAKAPVVEKPAPAKATTTPIVGGRFQQPQTKSRTGLYAALGLGLAAAAGVGWYVSTQMNKKSDGAQVAAVEQSAAPRGAAAAGSATAVTRTIEPIATPPAPEAAAADTTVATGMSGGAVAGPGTADDSKADEGRAKAKIAVKGAVTGKREDNDKAETPSKPAEVKVDPAKPTEKKGEGGEGEPSFDALLKEAGVQDKKPAKVVLDKKSLSGADIKKGMSSIDAKAQACYAGTQGTAAVKLTVSPDGSVSKVAVTGVFAGTPVASCIESAVKGVSFPAWDGGPQSFGYSYLLAE